MSALYVKSKAIAELDEKTNRILYRVHHTELTEEQGEQLIDSLIVKFNRELLLINKLDCAN